MDEPMIREGYVVIHAGYMQHCRDDVKEELFGTDRTCGGCYMDRVMGCRDCLVASDEVIVPEHLVAVIKMNQVQQEED